MCRTIICLTVLTATTLLSATVCAQDLRGLDRNRNGLIDPEEIDDRTRRYLQRYEGVAGVSVSKPSSVGRWEYAIRTYNDQRRAREERVVPDDEQTGIPGFGAAPGIPVVPGFGMGSGNYRYTIEDLEEADQTLRRADRNRDGFVDRQEALRAPWTRKDPFTSDFNQDNRLSRLELAQRYASRRLQERKEERTTVYVPRGDEGRREEYRRGSSSNERGRGGSSNERGRGGGGDSNSTDRTTRYLAESVLRKYDSNRNRVLELRESRDIGMDFSKVDLNLNGQLDQEELSAWLAEEVEESVNELADVLPAWFFERDANGDGQIEMFEFAESWTAETLKEFAQFDVDQDGFVTSDELLTSKTVVGGSYANAKAEVLFPGNTVVSEIEISDDFIIGDLNVQLSITHTYVEQLDGYLIGPDGVRIELFSGVGRSDDHFDKTVFDDEAANSIMRARPPFRGSFRPEGLEKRQPGLGHFKGKQLKGLWQLMVRSSRSDRAGLLNNWSLQVTPERSEEAGD